jgi:hypothetical protein
MAKSQKPTVTTPKKPQDRWWKMRQLPRNYLHINTSHHLTKITTVQRLREKSQLTVDVAASITLLWRDVAE